MATGISSVMMESSLGSRCVHVGVGNSSPYQHAYVLNCIELYWLVSWISLCSCRTGVCFCMLIWLVAVADNISDTVLGHSAHQIYLYILSVMFAMSAWGFKFSIIFFFHSAWLPQKPVLVALGPSLRGILPSSTQQYSDTIHPDTSENIQNLDIPTN